jgi:hypothetical protein
MKRRSHSLLVAFAAAVLAAGCGDALSPPSASSAIRADAAQIELNRSGHSRRGQTDFVLTPDGGDFRFGEFTLHVPAGAVCDPSSEYGEQYWDAPCQRLHRAVRVRVMMGEEDGQQWIDFSPDLRFAPSQRENRWVTLSTQRPVTQLQEALERGTIGAYALLYAPTIGENPVDEAKRDNSLVTHIQMGDGTIWRRIKHFSGFVISSGFICTPTPELACQSTTGEVDVIPETTATP